MDLVVVAEFLYYAPTSRQPWTRCGRCAAPGSQVVFLHWAHRPHDAFRSGPEMHARIFLDSPAGTPRKLVGHIDEDFLLDVYEVQP